jgi:hypothetical protein
MRAISLLALPVFGQTITDRDLREIVGGLHGMERLGSWCDKIQV